MVDGSPDLRGRATCPALLLDRGGALEFDEAGFRVMDGPIADRMMDVRAPSIRQRTRRWAVRGGP